MLLNLDEFVIVHPVKLQEKDAHKDLLYGQMGSDVSFQVGSLSQGLSSILGRN